MVRVYLTGQDLFLECAGGSNLYEVLSENGLTDAPCGGKGICGKCEVEVDGVNVLACLYEVNSNILVNMAPPTAVAEIISSGYRKDFIPQLATRGEYGAAIDIGTTTIVASLVDLSTGQERSSLSCLNSQKIFGQDVITRIHYAVEKENGIKILQHSLLADIRKLLTELYAQNDLQWNQMRKITVSGNTTMIHMLGGINPNGIAKAPYKPAFYGPLTLPARELGLPVPQDCTLYCLPAVSSYIGGDISAGILACGLAETRARVLFLDIGTNGEIVLSNRGKMCCCSCAAGPALEGMNIGCGMRAAAGAVDDIIIQNTQVNYSTIGGAEARGICGSGLLSAVSQMRQAGIIHRSGRMMEHPLVHKINGKNHFSVDEQLDLYLSQQDIRQVQLAKGAVLSGIFALLAEAGMEISSIDQVMVAGQFGAHLKAENLVGAGLLPAALESKITYVGNTSKSGAYLCLMSDVECKYAEEIISDIEYVELSTLTSYENLFIKCLNF